MISVGDHDDPDIERSRQTWHRRQLHIENFTRNQRLKRDWINFAEIMDWFADLAGPQGSSENSRAKAYQMLQQDLLDGDFEQNGRSAVRLLHPRMNRRMQPEYLRSILDTHGEAAIRSNVLPYCWIPRRLFEEWCAKHHLPTSPPRFQANHRNINPPTAEEYRTGVPGRPTSKHLIEMEFNERAERKETKDRLRQEAIALSEWSAKAHPKAPELTTKTIENNLRHRFHSLKSKKARK